jgi:putative addiction module CopG family antidote
MNVSLPPVLARFIRSKVKDGTYRDSDDAVRDAVRLLMRKERGTVLSALETLSSQLSDVRCRLEAMNEMSEMMLLRLQMQMDRRSKFIATLSNVMKKLSDTQETLVQNIK